MKVPDLLSVEWLESHLNDERLIILDVSPRSNVSNLVPYFPELQIEKARYFDMEKVFYDDKSEIPNMFPSAKKFENECRKLGMNNDSYIVVYDNLGIYTAPRAWWMFKSMGFNSVGVLNGGLAEWHKAGYKCERKINRAYPKGNLEANYARDMVCDADFIMEHLDLENHLIVDARSSGRFSGELPEPRPNMQSGHIPGSVNLPFKALLKDGKMKSVTELEYYFKEIDVFDKSMIFTCGSGVTACIVLLAATLVNANPKILFDGSWAAWGKGSTYPVSKS